MTVAVLLALLATAAQAISVPVPPGVPRSAAEAKGSAVIRGRVTAADTGRPLRRARVNVRSEGVTRSTSTNGRGEYEIKDLPAGRFTIGVTRSGYMPLGLGQKTPDDIPRPLQIAEGQAIERVDFALPRMGVISGRVVDETGEAVGDASVVALRYEFFRGRRQLVPTDQAVRTDDTGRYRLLNVPPGEVLVMATLRETWIAGPDRHAFAYAPTFFPGTASAGQAARVKAALGQETANVDIALVAARAAVVSGTATRRDGSPSAGATVSLNVQLVGNNWGTSFSAGSALVGADGSWRIANVAPGEYHLDATLAERGGPTERASLPLKVDGLEVSGVALVTDSGGTLTGSVVAEGGRQLPAPLSTLRVNAVAVGPNQATFFSPPSPDNGRVQEDGRFTLTAVSGPSTLRVTGVPAGWGISRIESDGRDLTDIPLEVAGGQSIDLRIVLSDRLPEVRGSITDAKGAATEGVVLLFPEDAARWADPSAIRTARPDQSGLFRFESLRPGDYLAVALPSAARWQVADPDFLDDLRARATSVSVRLGEPEQVSLRVR